jgi:hypothetical protein
MTERPGSDRTEYSVPSKAMLTELNEAARLNIENILLLERSSPESSLSYSYHDKTARRKLETIRLEDDELYEVLYAGKDGEIASVVLERAALVTHAVVTVDQHAEGNVEEVTELSILRWVDGVEHPFKTTYTLESLMGGAIQATVSHTDIINGQGLEEMPMTPYDYAELERELRLVAVARAGLTDAMLEKQ